MNQLPLRRYGSLDAYVLDSPGTDRPRALVVLCHGYGAPGSDLVAVAAEWQRLLGGQAGRFRFVCPIAPHSLAELGMPGGRAWWPLNMARMMQAIEAHRFDALHQETPPGLEEARQQLAELVAAAQAELADDCGVDVTALPWAMGGFSQGAMLTMDTALRGTSRPPDYLIQFSGTVICQADWTEALPRLAPTRVYQSHGTSDPILPFSGAERLRDLLAAAGIEHHFHAFPGPHTIDTESIGSTAIGLRRLLEEGETTP